MPETSIAPAEQKSDEFNLKFMTYENTLVLRAFAIISVIFAHTQVWAGFYFNNLGSIMVGLFFFLSGYGLTISKKNKPNYLKTFNRRRWASIFIPTVTTSILSFCIYAVYDAVSTENLYNILYQMVVSPISGFIYQLLIFYVFFYVFNKLFREKTALLMIWAGSGLLLIGNIMGYNADYNYENSFLFAIGATIAVYGDTLIKFTRKNYNKLLTVIGIVLLFACINFSLNVRYDVTYNLITTVSVLYVLILTVKKPEYNYPVFILILFMIFVMYGFWPDINTGGLDIMRDMTLIGSLGI